MKLGKGPFFAARSTYVCRNWADWITIAYSSHRNNRFEINF